MFEVQDLRYATLATVSRCGMVWFSEEVLSVDMMCENFMQRLRNVPVEEGEEQVTARARASGNAAEADEDVPPSLNVCTAFMDCCFCLMFTNGIKVCLSLDLLVFIYCIVCISQGVMVHS